MNNNPLTMKEFVIYLLIFAIVFGVLGFAIGDITSKRKACKAGIGAYIVNEYGNAEFVYTDSHEFKEFIEKHSKALEKNK